jgi:acetyl-CoA acetyltransferase
MAGRATTSAVLLAGAGEARYTRHAEDGRDTEAFIVDAVLEALEDAGMAVGDVDGLGVASFSLQPDKVIDLAWRMGMGSLGWLMEDTTGGASALNMLSHAARAVEGGDAEVVVLCAGDRIDKRSLHAVVERYNRCTRDLLGPLPLEGPNALFSFVTQRHARRHGLDRADYGCVPLAQRRWAAANPGAVHRAPLTLEDYLAAPPVAPPLHRYDCVPVVSGADAVVVTSPERAAGRPAAAVRALASLHNPDQQDGDGLASGFEELAAPLWRRAQARPEDVDCAFVYDDYPVMVAIQCADLGLAGGDLGRFLHKRLLEERWPLNTSGGMLSAGQAGAAGGMHGLVEAVRQLSGAAGDRQVDAELALVTGFGGVLYRHGACHVAALLERAAA